MNRKLRRLINQATQSAVDRGHELGEWVPVGFTGTRASAKCKICQMMVAVDTHPMPNEVEIGGAAVAVDCATGQAAWELLAYHTETGEPLSYKEAQQIYNAGIGPLWWDFEDVGGGLYKYTGGDRQ